MMIPRRTGTCLAAFALTLVWTSIPAHAQYTRNPARTISGTVTDASKEPLRGAVVQVEAADTLAIQSYITDKQGTYNFRELRSDIDYTLWAMFRGSRSKTYSIGKFDKQLDRTIPITIVLDK